jgi:hypothetical protein
LLLEGVEHWHSRQSKGPRSPRMSSQHPGRRIGLGVYLIEAPAASEAQLRRGR